MPQDHRKIRLLIVLVYVAFAFAYRIMMLGPGVADDHDWNLVGSPRMNQDILAEIIGAESIINGSFDVYTHRYFKAIAPPDGHAIGYPPLMFYLQAPIVFTGKAFGLKSPGVPIIAACGLLYVALSALCFLQVGVILQRCLNVKDQMTVTATVFLLTFSSLTFWVVTYNARFDLVVTLFLLLAAMSLTNSRFAMTGVWVGLALMTKQTALPAAIVFFAVLLASIVRNEAAWGSLLRFAVGLVLPVVILIPFVLASPRDVWAGLVEGPGKVIIMKGTLPSGILMVGKLISDAERLEYFLLRYSNFILLAICTVLIFVISFRRRIRPDSSRFFAMIALATFFCMLLSKNANIARHVVLASVFAVIWGASRKQGFPFDVMWFIVLQSFVLDHVPIIWKQYVGLAFYAVVFVYIWHGAFRKEGSGSAMEENKEAPGMVPPS